MRPRLTGTRACERTLSEAELNNSRNLKIEVSAAEETVEQLTTRGLMAHLALTPAGEAKLLRARECGCSHSHLDEADQQAARAVLDTIRERAELALARAWF
jgi:hypothetical protein